ncbi:MAG: tRNA (N(6)-L-threonylcarbamoyladenosine(37)-C(2))-methylthiotransferase MtaB [Oscillospiraceae bacterium]|nr:tRNA (N(6)-L-threonylcarbamoyladenosine(37)-C(2))-methylthiotransferase MtaB [Oscillospiraceae bacterium]
MTVFIETFGCKVNSYESAALYRLFGEAGYSAADTLQGADVVVINSCTVTENSDRKARAFINKTRRENPAAVLVLCGCFPQAFPEKTESLDVDVLMGSGTRLETVAAVQRFKQTGQKQNLLRSLEGAAFEPLEADELLEHTRAFLKIEDGCQRFCAYCAIPKARGPVRSMPLDEVRRQAQNFAAKGYREIVLAGINLSAYGSDLGCDLGDAVLAVAEAEGVVRIRLGSLECDILTDEILDKFARCDKFCPQFHLSLQSGSDNTLRRMHRRYRAAEYADVCERIRARFDAPTFTTDIICGFPGETEQDHKDSIAFCESIGFIRAHVFPYSRRGGTAAARMDGHLPRAEKERRAREMSAAMNARAEQELQRFVGRTARVVLEQPQPDGSYSGYTDRYLPARVYGEALCPNGVAEGVIEAIEGGCAVIRTK